MPKLKKENGESHISQHACAFVCMSSLFTHSSCRGFKALKQSTKILFLTLHRPEDALVTYRELLSYVKVHIIV